MELHVEVDFDKFNLKSQGAEAKIYEGTYLGKPAIIKERFKKSYRHTLLDEQINKKRMTSECRAISQCLKLGIRAPTIYLSDFDKRITILQNIPGPTLKDFINQNSSDKLIPHLEEVGKILATLHQAGIIHGDLTTCNFIVNDDGVYIIDFGLSEMNAAFEDKAVDLYVLEKVFMCTHLEWEPMFETILRSYKENYKKSDQVIQKLEAVRMRGRKRLMIG